MKKQIAKFHFVKRATTRSFWLTYKILEIRQNIFSPKLIKKLRNRTGEFRQIPEVSKMQFKKDVWSIYLHASSKNELKVFLGNFEISQSGVLSMKDDDFLGWFCQLLTTACSFVISVRVEPTKTAGIPFRCK